MAFSYASISCPSAILPISNSVFDAEPAYSSPFSCISYAICHQHSNARVRFTSHFQVRGHVRTVESSGFGWAQRERVFKSLNLSAEQRLCGVVAAVESDSPAIAGSLVAEESPERQLVSKLLSLVEGTDRGAQLGMEEHENVGKVVSELEKFCIAEPLQSPLIFGDWDVAYSSNLTSPGGIYRSWFGRLIFRTKEMIQTIGPPDIVVNIVRFALFGLITGEVILEGKLLPQDKKLIQVDFESPTFKLGPLKFKYGRLSSVKLAVIYLNDTLRLGRGSRGTVFVFKRR